jgi:cell division protein FtsI (penicillin-binding protein 3)
MMENNFLIRLYIIGFLLLVFSLGIFYKLFQIQFIDGDKYRKIAEDKTVKNFIAKPVRGNLYSSDGSILATTVSKYDIFIDTKIISDRIFQTELRPLCEKISQFKKTRFDDECSRIKKAREKNNRYLNIFRNINLKSLEIIKSFPILKYGTIKGGLIIENKVTREYPFGKIAERTVGYERVDEKGNFRGVGLEHAYGNFLRGKNGLVTKRKISNGQWKILDNDLNRNPINGSNVYSTIDVEIQDIVHDNLLEQTINFEADHSSAIVMEVSTGKIKAISNFGRTSEGKYYEKLNYAVGESLEPGSTFKLMSVISLLEDNAFDTIQKIDTKNGKLNFYGYDVKDSKEGGYGEINLMDIFRLSSNTGIVSAVNDFYKNQPRKFVNRISNIGIDEPLGIEIKGEPKPIFPHPDDKNWNGLSLPWMAYGYGISLTPLQILTFYNSIANNGEMVKPKFLEKVDNSAENDDKFKKEIINSSICSKKTLDIVNKMLYDVVHHPNGTANNIKSKYFGISGKTGTAQIDYNTDNINYNSSFVGFFPSDKPKYSCIITINKPNKKLGYYGSTVAGPVFKNIAEKIMSKYPNHLEFSLAEIERGLISNKITSINQ